MRKRVETGDSWVGPAGGGIRSAGRPLQSGKLDCEDDAGLWGHLRFYARGTL